MQSFMGHARQSIRTHPSTIIAESSESEVDDDLESYGLTEPYNQMSTLGDESVAPQSNEDEIYGEMLDISNPLTADDYDRPIEETTSVYGAPQPEADATAAETPVDANLYEAADTEIIDDLIPRTHREESFRRPNYVQHEPEALNLDGNPTLWDTADLLRWLKREGLEDFKAKFYSNGFVGRQVLLLNAFGFLDHGFSQDRCIALQTAIDALKHSVSTNDPCLSITESMSGSSHTPKPPPPVRSSKTVLRPADDPLVQIYEFSKPSNELMPPSRLSAENESMGGPALPCKGRQAILVDSDTYDHLPPKRAPKPSSAKKIPPPVLPRQRPKQRSASVPLPVYDFPIPQSGSTNEKKAPLRPPTKPRSTSSVDPNVMSFYDIPNSAGLCTL